MQASIKEDCQICSSYQFKKVIKMEFLMTYKHDDIQDGGIACDTSISSKKIYFNFSPVVYLIETKVLKMFFLIGKKRFLST